MALQFPYVAERMAQPVRELGGRWARPRPLIDVTVIGPTGSRSLQALLDTGADTPLIPVHLASRVGVDLASALPITIAPATPAGSPLARLTEVTLRLTDGVEVREWSAWVAFAANVRRPLLGFAGCLQFFTATASRSNSPPTGSTPAPDPRRLVTRPGGAVE